MRSAAGVAAVVLLLPACGGSGADKAGGGDNERPVVLTIATRETNDAWVNFAAAVETESHGTVRVEPRTGWRAAEGDYERATIADVREGIVDLAEVGAGVWDTVGVTSFRSLVAPFLIDDMDLQRRVLESPLVPAMLDGVRPLGLVGLAVLPGELRRPLGLTRTLLGPEDYVGARVSSRAGRVGRATWAALGVRPMTGAAAVGAVGAESDPATIDSNRLALQASSLTSNVVLWPRVRTIVAGRRAFEQLTHAQQDALLRAGRSAIEPALQRVEGDEVRGLDRSCRRGTLRLVSASRRERAALVASVRPVYAALERDSRTREQIEAIRRLRGGDRATPAVVHCRASVVSQTSATATSLDGTWRMTVSRDELIRLGTPPVEAAAVRGRWTYT